MKTLKEAIKTAEAYWLTHHGATAVVREDDIHDLEHGWLFSPNWLEEPKKNIYIGQSQSIIVDGKLRIHHLTSDLFVQLFQEESFRRIGKTRSKLPPAVYLKFDRWAEQIEPEVEPGTDEEWSELELERLAWFDSNRDEIVNVTLSYTDLDLSKAQTMMNRLRQQTTVLLFVDSEHEPKDLLDVVNNYRFLEGSIFRKLKLGKIVPENH